MPAHLRVSEEAKMKCIRKFPLGSAKGGSGLRSNHIYELSKAQHFWHGSTFISSITKFVNPFLSKKRTRAVAPWLCGAPLMAFNPQPRLCILPLCSDENERLSSHHLPSCCQAKMGVCTNWPQPSCTNAGSCTNTMLLAAFEPLPHQALLSFL